MTYRECSLNSINVNIQQKTKTTIIDKHHARCKLVNDNEIIEQTSKVNYFGIKLTNNGNIEWEVSEQLMKANCIIGCLDDCVWRNKYLNRKNKVQIYKSVVRPITTYACEASPDSMKIKGQTQVAEMKVLRKIIVKTRRERIFNENIRHIIFRIYPTGSRTEDTNGTNTLLRWTHKE
jgi:hypothetical protein